MTNEDRFLEILFDELPSLIEKIPKIGYANITYLRSSDKVKFCGVYFTEEAGSLRNRNNVRDFVIKKYKSHWGTLEGI